MPYVNLSDMSGVLNSNNIEINTVFDTFMLIELVNGDNNIILSHTPLLIKICALVTLIAVLIFIICSIINKFFHISNSKFVVWFGFIGGCLILLIVGFLVYLKPLFNFFMTLLAL